MKRQKATTLSAQLGAEDRRASLILTFPAVLILLAFIVYPIFDSFGTSLLKWNGISAEKQFMGLGNWQALITDSVFWKAFLNNIEIMVLSILIQLPFALLLATFLNVAGHRAKPLKCLWFIPMLMSSVAVGFLFKFALSTTDGIFTTLSMMTGGGRIDLLGSNTRALPTVIGVICWQFIPYYMIFFLASYSTIDKCLYEASMIDGATKPKYFFFVALPLLKPYIRNAAILSMVGSLKYFDLIYVMTGGGPGTSTELMATYMYRLSFREFNMSYGSTVASGMLIVITLFAALTMKLTTRKED